MEKIEYKTIYWAKMPDYTSDNVKGTHRKRPYYIITNAGNNSYYSLPMTSQEHLNKNLRTSQVNYQSVGYVVVDTCDVLPRENLLRTKSDGEIHKIKKVSSCLEDEIMKSMYIQRAFYKYPSLVKKIVNDYVHSHSYLSTDILVDKKLNKLIVYNTYNKCAYNVTYVPTKGYKEFQVNEIRCFIDVNNPFTIKDFSEYNLYNYSKELPYIVSGALYSPTTQESINMNNINELPIGTVIEYKNDGQKRAIIKVDENDNEYVFMVYSGILINSNNNIIRIPKNKNVDYTPRFILTDRKYNHFISKNKY